MSDEKAPGRVLSFADRQRVKRLRELLKDQADFASPTLDVEIDVKVTKRPSDPRDER